MSLHSALLQERGSVNEVNSDRHALTSGLVVCRWEGSRGWGGNEGGARPAAVLGQPVIVGASGAVHFG